MFKTLFAYPKVVRRHRDGPFADERAAYLAKRAAQGVSHATLIKEAQTSLRVAVELERWPADHGFSIDEVREMASGYATRCRAEWSRHARDHFRTTALDWLRHLGRLRPEPTGLPHRCETMLRDFIAYRRERNWLSDATSQLARWQMCSESGCRTCGWKSRRRNSWFGAVAYPTGTGVILCLRAGM